MPTRLGALRDDDVDTEPGQPPGVVGRLGGAPDQPARVVQPRHHGRCVGAPKAKVTSRTSVPSTTSSCSVRVGQPARLLGELSGQAELGRDRAQGRSRAAADPVAAAGEPGRG